MSQQPLGSEFESPVMCMQLGLFDHGCERATKSGALEPIKADVESLEKHARAMARETHRDLFDPKKHEHDRLLENEYKKWLIDRAELETAAKFTAATVREKKQQLAELQSGLKPPKTAHMLMAAVLIVISVTVAPTLHDFVYSTITDDILAWFMSLLSGCFLGAVITWAILGAIGTTGRRSTVNLMGLIAGVTISIALGIFRVTGTKGKDELALAIALTLVEIGVIILAEWVAIGLRDSHREWAAQQQLVSKAEAESNAAEVEDHRVREQLAIVEEKIKNYIDYVADRTLRNLNVQELEAQATKAVSDGYNHGLALNRGRVLGTEKNHGNQTIGHNSPSRVA